MLCINELAIYLIINTTKQINTAKSPNN
jgi:hypothetical protein